MKSILPIASLALLLGFTACGRRTAQDKEPTSTTPAAESAAAEVEDVAASGEVPVAESVVATSTATQHEKNCALVQSEAQKRQAEFASNANILVRPGLLANREARTVELAVEATGIAKNAIVEFFVISEKSGHDYESLFVSLATARDLHEALQFIGMKPGRNAFATPLSLWPRGERVMATVVIPDGNERSLESLVLDRDSDSGVLSSAGFLYCGSFESKLTPGGFAADVDEPGSILSTYNEPTTLLDVPRQASQNAVYERYRANPDEAMQKGALLRLRLQPEIRTAEQGDRVQDRTLVIRENAGLQLDLLGSDADARDMNPTALLTALRDLASTYDPYITLRWDDTVTLKTAFDFATTLSVLDTEGGIHVEAPEAGQLYYRAFLPQSAWRDRTKRPTQPCELRFQHAEDGSLTVTLLSLKEIWPEDDSALVPEIQATEIPVPSVDAFPGLLQSTENEIAALLVFAPANATLGEMMPYIRAVQESKSNVFLFVE